MRRTESSVLFSKHFRNQLRVYSSRFGPFKAIVEETWPGVQIRELSCPRPMPGEPISLNVRNEDFVAEIAAMGHGLQMWLQTMWFIARIGAAVCVVLDEPDVYMHPDLQRRLVRYLRRAHQQVIVATHSIEMMSEVEPEEILVIDRHRDSSQFTSDAGAVQRFVGHMGSAHNIQLARLGNARKCLLVEGKDVKLLMALHKVLFPRAESLETIPNMSLGGWGGWQYAIGSSMFLEKSGAEDISIYCILDRDYHSAAAVARRGEEARNRNVRLHIWRQKEIENYFLVPAAIIRTIRRKMPARAAPPTEQEVLTQLDGICEELHEDVFDAISAELLAENRALGAGGANKAAREILSEAWKTLEGKLRTVSGKQVFHYFSRWSQEQFGVPLSAATIAREFLVNDISNEIKKVLMSIEEGNEFEDALGSPLD